MSNMAQDFNNIDEIVRQQGGAFDMPTTYDVFDGIPHQTDQDIPYYQRARHSTGGINFGSQDILPHAILQDPAFNKSPNEASWDPMTRPFHYTVRQEPGVPAPRSTYAGIHRAPSTSSRNDSIFQENETTKSMPDYGVRNRRATVNARPSKKPRVHRDSLTIPPLTRTRSRTHSRSSVEFIPYNCPRCRSEKNVDREISNSTDQRKHNLTHDRPFCCAVEGCQRFGFATSNDLERHQKTNHGIALRHGADLYFKCKVPGCTKAERPWDRKDNFKQHIARCHKDLTQSDKDHWLKESQTDLTQKEKDDFHKTKSTNRSIRGGTKSERTYGDGDSNIGHDHESAYSLQPSSLPFLTTPSSIPRLHQTPIKEEVEGMQNFPSFDTTYDATLIALPLSQTFGGHSECGSQFFDEQVMCEEDGEGGYGNPLMDMDMDMDMEIAPNELFGMAPVDMFDNQGYTDVNVFDSDMFPQDLGRYPS